MKVDVAEFLFPIVLANLAQRKETSSNLRQLVSSQVIYSSLYGCLVRTIMFVCFLFLYLTFG